MKKCQACGSVFLENAKFCSNCGVPVTYEKLVVPNIAPVLPDDTIPEENGSLLRDLRDGNFYKTVKSETRFGLPKISATRWMIPLFMETASAI